MYLNRNVKTRNEYLSVAGIIFVGLVWGLGFPALKVMAEVMPTFQLIAVRFIIASLLLAAVFYRRMRHVDRKLLKSALLLSVFLFLTYTFATIGIQHTSSAKASFFCCLGVLFIPLIAWKLNRTRISRRVAVSILVCTAGLFLISYSPGMGLYLNPGDILCLCCSLTAAFHVVFVGRLAVGQDPALLTIFQLFFIAVYASIASILFEQPAGALAAFDIANLAFLAIFCTAAAFLIQTASQRFISPSRVGVIFSIEPVSGALFSSLLLGDRLGLAGIAGGTLIVASIIIMESGTEA